MDLLQRRKVPANADTITKCMCMKCPVQIASSCAIGQNQKLLQENKLAPRGMPEGAAGTGPGGMSGGITGMASSVQSNPPSQPEAQIPSREELPGIYCSNGQATCGDIDMAKNCICPSCQVWKDYTLANAKPMEHFCFNDRAQ